MRTEPSHSLSDDVLQKISMKLSNTSTCSNWENRCRSHEDSNSFMEGLFEEDDDETRDGHGEVEVDDSCEGSFLTEEEEEREAAGGVSYESKSFESCHDVSQQRSQGEVSCHTQNQDEVSQQRSEVTEKSVVSSETSFVSCDVSHGSEQGSKTSDESSRVTEKSVLSSVESYVLRGREEGSKATEAARGISFSSNEHSTDKSSLASDSPLQESTESFQADSNHSLHGHGLQGYVPSDASSHTFKAENVLLVYQAEGSATVASHTSSAMEKKVEFASLSRVCHDNDILVEIEAFTIKSPNLMNRPGLRCPASLPVPISTIGVDCIGRVVHSSANAALHGILFRDRVCAIYPFEYEKRRVWNGDGGNMGCAYLDAGLTVPIPKYVDAAEAATVLHTYTPAFQSIQDGMLHANPFLSDQRYNTLQLEGKSILIQNGHTVSGLALIELALALGAEKVYATGSCVHRSLLEGAGAIPLGLVEKKEDRLWETWKTIQKDKSISLVLMQEMPSLSMLDMFMSVLSMQGSVVMMGSMPKTEDDEGENDENTPPNNKMDNKDNLVSSDDLIGFVEKARVAHEKSTLNLRLSSCSQLVIYQGVMAGIVEDPLAWKEDVSFLINLLADGTLKPLVQKRVYCIEDVPILQEQIDLYGDEGSFVCLPSKKWSNPISDQNKHIGILGGCSLRTRMEAAAVTKISAAWRRFAFQQEYKCTILAARRVDALIQQLREDSATLVQSKWREYSTKSCFEQTISNVAVIQYFIRRFIAWRRLVNLREAKRRREAGASTKIATVWRRSSCRRWYLCTIDDIVMCQSMARRKFGLKKLAALRAAEREEFARLIQAEWKSRVAKRRVNRVLLNMRNVQSGEAAVKIQSVWRGYVGAQCFAYYRYNAIILQTFGRKLNAQSQYHRSIRDVTMCQATVRKYFAVKMAEALRNERDMMRDVTMCQATARKYLAVKKTEALRHERDLAHAKENLAKLKVCMAVHTILQYRFSAVLLQRHWRGWAAKQQYKQQMIAIAKLQIKARRYLAAKKAKALKLRMPFIILIQAWWRGCVAKRSFTAYRFKIVTMVVALQSIGRRKISRSQFLLALRVSAICQRLVRRFLAVKTVTALRHLRDIASATVIQAQWRGTIARKRYIRFHQSTILLEKVVRGWAAKKEFKRTVRDITVCQSSARRMIDKRKTDVLRSHMSFWRQEAALTETDKRGESYRAFKNRHLASTKIQVAYCQHIASMRSTDALSPRNNTLSPRGLISDNCSPRENDETPCLTNEVQLSSANPLEMSSLDAVQCQSAGSTHSNDVTLNVIVPDETKGEVVSCFGMSIAQDDALSSCIIQCQHAVNFATAERVEPWVEKSTPQLDALSASSQKCEHIKSMSSNDTAMILADVEQVTEELERFVNKAVSEEELPVDKTVSEKDGVVPFDETLLVGDIHCKSPMNVENYDDDSHCENNYPPEEAAPDTALPELTIEKEDFAQFVSAVVVIHTFLHDKSEKKRINAGIVEMDQFEFDNIYKGMLYGIDNPADAMKQIITCQSAARRLIAMRQYQKMQIEVQNYNNYWRLAATEEEKANASYVTIKQKYIACTKIQLAFKKYADRKHPSKTGHESG